MTCSAYNYQGPTDYDFYGPIEFFMIYPRLELIKDVASVITLRQYIFINTSSYKVFRHHSVLNNRFVGRNKTNHTVWFVRWGTCPYDLCHRCILDHVFFRRFFASGSLYFRPYIEILLSTRVKWTEQGAIFRYDQNRLKVYCWVCLVMFFWF